MYNQLWINDDNFDYFKVNEDVDDEVDAKLEQTYNETAVDNEEEEVVVIIC